MRTAVLRIVPVVLVVALVAAGCTTVAPTATPTLTPSPTPTATLMPTSTPTVASTPTATPTMEAATPTVTPLPTELFLDILEPADESVVSQSPVVVRGRTTPDATVSVSGQAVEVDVNGEFIVEVALAPGPNIIEFAASNLEGKQETALLSLIYLQ